MTPTPDGRKVNVANPTPDEIATAKERLNLALHDGICQNSDIRTLLAALEQTEKDRDEWKRIAYVETKDNGCVWRDRAEALEAKLAESERELKTLRLAGGSESLARHALGEAIDQRDEAQAERDALRAEVSELRQAVGELLDHVEMQNADVIGAIAGARAALAIRQGGSDAV